jgi:hypothetical protein
MQTQLTSSEEQYLDALLKWDRSHRSSDWLMCNLCLLAACLVIVVAAVFTVYHLNDRVILGLLAPSFLVGLVLVGAHLFNVRRIRERHQLAMIIGKIRGAA